MANRKEVWTVSPRGEGKKDFWLRVGTAFENRDGSWSIVLDALPVHGKLIVRDERPRDEEAAPRGREMSESASRRGQQRTLGGDDEIPF